MRDLERRSRRAASRITPFALFGSRAHGAALAKGVAVLGSLLLALGSLSCERAVDVAAPAGAAEGADTSR